MIKTLENLCQMTGNSWICESDLRRYWMKKTGSNSLSFLNKYINNGEIIVSRKNEENIITTDRFFQTEIQIANEIFRIKSAPAKIYSDQYLDKLIDKVEQKKGLILHIDQRNAVKNAVNSTFMVLVGGPGTGKTCVLNVLNDVLYELDKDMAIVYAAPTGNAAKRITESTGFEAKTLHSLLKIADETSKATKLSAFFKTLTVDEISMLDMFVALQCFSSVPTGCRLYLVGDTDQLPSVGPGAVLRDIIQSGAVNVSRLTKTFRQSGDSILFDNIQRVKNGNAQLYSGDDFKIAVPSKTTMSPKDILLYLYKREVQSFGIDNVMCLTPYRQHGETCSNVMNQEIQKLINPSGPSIPFYQGVLRKNDIIIQLENRKECVNGDIGKVTGIYKNGIVCQYNTAEVSYGLNELKQLSLAYAMSIHKSQGSEAKSIVTTLLPEHKAMLQRNLLYTAITRAKKCCTLLTEGNVLKEAVQNESSSTRVTLLTEWLITLKNKEELSNVKKGFGNCTGKIAG